MRTGRLLGGIAFGRQKGEVHRVEHSAIVVIF